MTAMIFAVFVQLALDESAGGRWACDGMAWAGIYYVETDKTLSARIHVARWKREVTRHSQQRNERQRTKMAIFDGKPKQKASQNLPPREVPWVEK